MKVELRTCVHCGEEKEIKQRFRAYANNICLECERKRSKEYQRLKSIKEGRRVGITGRVPYPLEPEWKHMNDKFRAMAIETIKIKEREEWILELRKRLEIVLHNKEVMDWINGHRDDDKPKAQKRINKEYPDTRYITWEEYTKGLGKDDVDS